MGVSYNSVLNRDGLVLHLCANVPRSYPGSGTTWYDISGNNNHGSMLGGVTYLSSNGGAMDFDGADDRVDVSSNLNLKVTNLTLSSWLYMKTSPNVDRENAIVFDTGSQDAYGFRIKNGGTASLQGWYFILGGSGLFYNTTAHNVWYHVTGTCGPSGLAMYINGNLISSAPSPTIVSYSTGGTQRFFIGSNGSISWPIRVDDLRIYNRELLSSEIKQIFNSTRKRFGV